jgi:hypothetical protein
MLNRALIVALVIVSLGIAGILGYSLATTDEPPAAPTETPSDTDRPQQLEPKPPEIFEKDVKMVWPTFWIPSGELDKKWHEERLAESVLKFIMYAGDRAEGQVIVWTKSEDGKINPKEEAFLFAAVLDPHGNIIMKNYQYNWTTFQKYPWRFSFIASTTGEHGILVHTGPSMMIPPYGANLKVTVYDE